MDIKGILNNKGNIYFAHGTGTDKKNIIKSIMEHGVRCTHGALQYASIYLGSPENIREFSKDIITNWFYRNSSIVFIISLPKKYFIFENDESKTMQKEHSAYYYIPTKEQQETFLLQNKPHVYSEFIVGYYDSNTKEFTENPNYYEKLDKEKQKELFHTIEENYIQVINNCCGVDKYKELSEKYNYKYAVDEDMINIDKLLADIDRKIEELEKEEAEYKKNQSIPEIPRSLKKYVYIQNGKIFAKQKLPKELEKDFEIFMNINELIEGTKNDELDIVYEMYAELYEKKFGRKAYIPEPSGTKEQAIKAIKRCLERNEDILDKIYYPDNNLVYSDKFIWKENEIQIIDVLNRKVLISAINNWSLEYKNPSNEDYRTLMNTLEEEINKYAYYDDRRFVTYGRRDFLYQEFKDYLNDKKQNTKNKYFNALINLEEFIKADSSFFNPSQLPTELRKDFHKLLKDHDDYNKLSIICTKEKDIIMEMIQEFKSKL